MMSSGRKKSEEVAPRFLEVFDAAKPELCPVANIYTTSLGSSGYFHVTCLSCSIKNQE